MKICCFAGHSKIYSDTKVLHKKIKDKAEELITKENIKEFWCGNYGSFDKISANAVRELKKIYPHIKLILIIPYITKEINEYRKQYHKEYDEIVIANIPEKTPKKYHIIKTNEYMIDNSDFLISYVIHSWGGAAKTLEYAKRNNKIKIIGII